MSTVKGKVGSWQLEWKSAPRGATGSSELEATNGKHKLTLRVSWRKDPHGLWLELPTGVHGFDFEGERGDDGRVRFLVSEREGDGMWAGLGFARAGEEAIAAAGGTRKGGLKTKAQMPGKIVRVLARQGESVEKDQAVLVMEAMKMENEIRAPGAGVLAKIAVSEGQAVETGAELFILESGPKA